MTFPITFANTNYKVIVTSSNQEGNTGGINYIAEPVNTQKINLYYKYSNSSGTVNGWNTGGHKTDPMWIAIGQ